MANVADMSDLGAVVEAIGGTHDHVRAILSADRDGPSWVVEVWCAVRPEARGSRKGAWFVEGRGPTLTLACRDAVARVAVEQSAGLFRLVAR